MKRWIFSENVILPDSPDPVEALIGVEGRVIVTVERVSRANLPSVEGPFHDFGAMLVTPAFVNAHTHLAMVAFRALGGQEARKGNVVEDLWFRVERSLKPEDVRAFARIGALECVLAGQGAAYDHYYHAAAVASGMQDVGLEGVVAETVQDLGGPAADLWESSLQLASDLFESVSPAQHGIAVALGPHATDTVSQALWERLGDLAGAHDVPVHLHVAQSEEEVERALEAGFRSPIDRLVREASLERFSRVWMAHGIYASPADLALLEPSRDTLVHCPMSQSQFAFPAPVRLWNSEGFPVVLGTDAGACNDGMDVQREVSWLAWGESYRLTHSLQHYASLAADTSSGIAGFREARASLQTDLAYAQPRDALAAVWSAAGRLHRDFQAGMIAPGARASLCIWDLEHPAFWPAEEPLRAVAFGSPQGALHTVMIGGETIGDVGDPKAILRREEVKGWIGEARQRLDALLRRSRHA